MSEPTCNVCGKLQSVGCANPAACEFATFQRIGSVDPAAMAELMGDPDEQLICDALHLRAAYVELLGQQELATYRRTSPHWDQFARDRFRQEFGERIADWKKKLAQLKEST
jgi:hypothetical protein